MKYALVCNTPSSYSAVVDGMWTTVACPVNTIINLIIYDGISEFTAPAGLTLMQVADSKQVGDLAN